MARIVLKSKTKSLTRPQAASRAAPRPLSKSKASKTTRSIAVKPTANGMKRLQAEVRSLQREVVRLNLELGVCKEKLLAGRQRAAKLRSKTTLQQEALTFLTSKFRELQTDLQQQTLLNKILQENNDVLSQSLPNGPDDHRGAAGWGKIRDSIAILGDNAAEDVRLRTSTVRPYIRTPPPIKRRGPHR